MGQIQDIWCIIEVQAFAEDVQVKLHSWFYSAADSRSIYLKDKSEVPQESRVNHEDDYINLSMGTLELHLLNTYNTSFPVSGG